MPNLSFKNLLLVSFVLGGLSACDMPTEPAGIHEEGFAHIAERLQQQGDDAGAVDFYQRALQRKPNDVMALQKLGGILEAHGNIEAAEGFYARALNVEPENHDLLGAEGRVLIRLGRAADARAVYQKALDDDRHDVKALNGMGVALDYLGQHDEAQGSYRSALDYAPEDLSTINNLAHSYVLSGKYDQAIALLEPHATGKNSTPQLRQNLAEAYGLSGMYADAERMARIDLKPQEVKRNLAFYRSRRSKLSLEPRLIADLGSYPTKEVAEANAENIGHSISDKTITITAKSEVQTIGGTPSFVVQATGFKTAAALNQFCQGMTKNGETCRPVKP